MATIILLTDSKGNWRCDAHCYDAKHRKCTCICGGKNHGVGFMQALINADEDKALEAHDATDETYERNAGHRDITGLD
ncbi:unnamed protein product [marine sediment metagenome]|uniref:Uncharacterized protein n=1 Tax=marine sediment metagenome TaxID=412755 RepID=X1RQ79_9ZZZZ